MKKFTIEFRKSDSVLKVELDSLEAKSLLEIALDHDVDIDHACGGVCACSTCHVIIRDGYGSCGESTDAEEDQLDKAPGLTSQSRLACQTIPDGSQNLVVEIPNWNRNLVRE